VSKALVLAGIITALIAVYGAVVAVDAFAAYDDIMEPIFPRWIIPAGAGGLAAIFGATSVALLVRGLARRGTKAR